MTTRPAWMLAIGRILPTWFLIMAYDRAQHNSWLTPVWLALAFVYAWNEAYREKSDTGGTTPLRSESERETVKT